MCVSHIHCVECVCVYFLCIYRIQILYGAAILSLSLCLSLSLSVSVSLSLCLSLSHAPYTGYWCLQLASIGGLVSDGLTYFATVARERLAGAPPSGPTAESDGLTRPLAQEEEESAAQQMAM